MLFVQIEQEKDFHKQVFPYSVPFGLKCEASKTGGVEVVSPFTIMIRIITNVTKNNVFLCKLHQRRTHTQVAPYSVYLGLKGGASKTKRVETTWPGWAGLVR